MAKQEIVKCETCNGKGYRGKHYFAPEVTPAEIDCEDCNGTGVKLKEVTK